MFKRTSTLVLSLLLASPTYAVRLGMMNQQNVVPVPDGKVAAETGI